MVPIPVRKNSSTKTEIKQFLVQKCINYICKFLETRTLLFLFMSYLSLAFPWTVRNTVSKISCISGFYFNILSEISKEIELSAKSEVASTESGCSPAAFVTVLCKAKSVWFAFLSLAPSYIHLLTARTNSQTQVSSFHPCLQILSLNTVFFWEHPRWILLSCNCWLLFLDWSQTNVRWNNKHETTNDCVHCHLLNT